MTDPILARLRAEATALTQRADQLKNTSTRLEAQLARLLTRSGGRVTPQMAEVRAAAKEALALLEDTIRRRNDLRERIAKMEAVVARRDAATPARQTRPTADLVSSVSAAATAPERISPADAAPVPAINQTALPPSVRADAPLVVAPVPATKAAEIAAVELSETLPAPAPALAPAPAPAPATVPVALPEPAAVSQREPRTAARQHVGRERAAWRFEELPALARTLHLRHALTALLGALLLVLTLLLTPLPELFGWQLFAVQTGSMEPAIPVGSIIAVQPVPASGLKVGDVITFADRNRPEMRVTHRIVSLETRDGQQVAITKGDANNTTDSWNVPLQSAIGRVAFHLPLVGYAVYWLSSPPVRAAALLAVVALMVGPAIVKRRREGRDSSAEATPTYESLEHEIEALLTDSPTTGAQRNGASSPPPKSAREKRQTAGA